MCWKWFVDTSTTSKLSLSLYPFGEVRDFSSDREEKPCNSSPHARTTVGGGKLIAKRLKRMRKYDWKFGWNYLKWPQWLTFTGIFDRATILWNPPSYNKCICMQLCLSILINFIIYLATEQHYTYCNKKTCLGSVSTSVYESVQCGHRFMTSVRTDGEEEETLVR